MTPLSRQLENIDLSRRNRLVIYYVLAIVGVVLLYTLLYNAGMRVFEGRPQSIFRSFQTVTETMTTTGYGADSPWTTPVMNVFVVTMQLTGIVIGFVTLRVLVIPLFERAPLNLDDRLSSKQDHVVVAEYKRDTGVLLDELEELGVSYVLVESDPEEAKTLSDAGYQAIHGDPETRADLERASIGKASTLITDAGDRTASIVLTALEANEGLRVISFTPSLRRKAALAEVGVDRSVSPDALIGRRLAEKATLSVALEEPTDEIVIREVLIRRHSPLHGARIADTPVVTNPDLTLVAGWFDGEFHLPPDPDNRITPNTVLVVAGPAGAVEAAASQAAGVRTARSGRQSSVVVAGFGEGGRAAVEALPEDVSYTTVDQSTESGADVVGDVTEPETLRAADIEDASALVVTVDDDATALLTVAMARALSDGVEVLARVTDAEKASPAFRAGADYVLSVQRVCARLVAAEVHGERVIDPVGQIRLVRAASAPFAGQSLADIRRQRDRGWTVVGALRDGDVLTDAATTVEVGDEVFVAGSDEAIAEFERTVDVD
jgi:Trk K+ transport system NAD-binding subunit